jgi:hypothetical protein
MSTDDGRMDPVLALVSAIAALVTLKLLDRAVDGRPVPAHRRPRT